MARAKSRPHPRKNFSTPAYRRQARPGGKDDAFVLLGNRRQYLGPYDSPDSRERYHRVIAEWEAGGRSAAAEPDEITVIEVANRYLAWASIYYVKHGKQTSEPSNIGLAVRPLVGLYGSTAAGQFGPKALKTVRQAMIDHGWVRKRINRQVDRIKRMFKWAVAEEIVPSGIYEALRAVSGLRFGRCGAHDNPPVQPAQAGLVEPVKQHVSRQVAAMIDLQLLTGARPGEIVIMRPCDVDRSDSVWVYRPTEHKTEHHGHDRLIYMGPKAQEVLAPFLLRSPEAYCFSPIEAEHERRALQSEQSASGGRHFGRNRRRSPLLKPGEHYTVDSYRRAIERGIEHAHQLPAELAQLPTETCEQWRQRLGREGMEKVKAWRKAHHWHPHQLRHSYATYIRKADNLEAAQILLGHSKADVTQIYAERDIERAKGVALRVG